MNGRPGQEIARSQHSERDFREYSLASGSERTVARGPVTRHWLLAASHGIAFVPALAPFLGAQMCCTDPAGSVLVFMTGATALSAAGPVAPMSHGHIHSEL